MVILIVLLLVSRIELMHFSWEFSLLTDLYRYGDKLNMERLLLDVSAVCSKKKIVTKMNEWFRPF